MELNTELSLIYPNSIYLYYNIILDFSKDSIKNKHIFKFCVIIPKGTNMEFYNNTELKLELCIIIHISGRNRNYTYYIQVLLLCRGYRNVVIRAIVTIWLHAVYGVESSYIA